MKKIIFIISIIMLISVVCTYSYSDVIDYKEISKIEYYDLRNEDVNIEVRDQKNTNTCWSFSSLGILESMDGEKYNYSEDHMIRNLLFESDYQIGGNRYRALSYLVSWKGPVLEEEDAFLDGKSPSDLIGIKRLQEAYYFENSVKEIKKAVYDYGGVSVTTYSPGKKYDEYFNEKYNSYNNPNKKTPDHEVIIIGWDDNYSKYKFQSNPKNNGAYIVKNSYGVNWGESGYYYVSYEDMTIGDEATVYVRVDDVDVYKNIYQYDLAGRTHYRGYNTSKAYFANVFLKKSNEEILAAVSFYTSDKNSKYMIYYVDNYRLGNDLNKRIKIKEGVILEKGYHTIDFDGIELSRFGKFAVIVLLDTPNSKFPIITEEPTDVTVGVTSKNNQSFVSKDGNKWSDFTKFFENGNVCLKAFTKNKCIIESDE